MKYTYEQPDYLDVNGARHLVQELKKYIQDIMNGKIDISQYATKDELSSAVSSIDLSAYAKKTDLPSLDGYAKTTDIPSVEGLATKSYVDENIAKVATSGDIDLSNYVTKDTVYTKEQTDALIPSVPRKVSELENDSNYLSSIPEEYVTETELNAKGYLTSHQDLSAYALKTEIPTVPSLDGYATTQYVDNAIANVPSGGNVDLSNYYTKAETNALIPSTDGLATTEYVDNAISNIPATDLSNYYTKDETYSKTEVDTLVANSGGSSSGGSGTEGGGETPTPTPDPTPTETYNVTIESSSNEIRVGGSYKSLTAKVTDANGNDVTANYSDATFTWTCSIDNEDYTNNCTWRAGSEFNQKKIKMSTDMSYAGKNMVVTVVIGDTITGTTTLEITA